MTAWTLLRRNLVHFRWANLAVAAGVAVATAVLAGALIVGDSVNGSLRDLAAQRLGPVDFALGGGAFFRDDLGRRVRESADLRRMFPSCAAGIVVRGSAATADESVRAAGVQIGALDDWLPVAGGACVVNAHLAGRLGIRPGDTIVLTVPRATGLPAQAILARLDREDRLAGLRVTVTRIAEAGWEASFSLNATQREQSLAWVNLGELQRLIDPPDQDAATQPAAGRANLLLLHLADDLRDSVIFTRRPDPQPKVDDLLFRPILTLDDYGLETHKINEAEAALTSRTTYLPPAVQAALETPLPSGEGGSQGRARATSVTEQSASVSASSPSPLPLSREGRGVDPTEVLVHLVNTVERPATSDGREARQTHYAIAAGMDFAEREWLADDEVALNEWSARQLDARLGDRITLTYFVRAPDGTLTEKPAPAEFRVAGILPMKGYGADPSLTPQYKGITDAESIAAWNPPSELTIRDEWIKQPDDEDYWRQYKAAPKLLLNLPTAQRLWAASFGGLTSVRVPLEQEDLLRQTLLEQLHPAEMGLPLLPARRQQLYAASASTDFGQLFLGLSFFLIAAAAFLIALLFRLAVEQRAQQYGLLLSLGFGPRQVTRLTLAEGGLVALAGVTIGLLGSAGYAAAMLAALRTWWVGAVGTTALRLHVQPTTLGIAAAASLAVAMAAMLWGAWRVGRSPATALLGGGWGVSGGRRGGRLALAVAIGVTLAGAAVLALPLYAPVELQWATLGGSAILLIAALAGMTVLLRPRRLAKSQAASALGLLRLAVRNAGRRPARSVLTAGLLAMATYIVVIVAAFRQDRPADTHEPRSGAGGYSLVARADIALPNDLSTPKARRVARLTNPDDPLWEGLRFVGLPRRTGQDISCLNLTRAIDPTILAAPPAEQWNGRFTFARTTAHAENPWTLLDGPTDRGVPVIADDETARYILHVGLGQELSMTDWQGRRQTLRLAGTLHTSIFQGELLMSRSNFERLFPQAGGIGVVLVEGQAQKMADARRQLSTELADYSAEVDFTADVIARYLEVANTYLSTFQTLGALGLTLGAVGLTVVLLRNLIERCSELALLAALGFSPARRAALMICESGFLLLAGLVLGLVVGLITVLPVASAARKINWSAVLLSLAAAALVSLAVQTIAGMIRGRRFRVADLRPE